jgi:hypothetical protein
MSSSGKNSVSLLKFPGERNEECHIQLTELRHARYANKEENLSQLQQKFRDACENSPISATIKSLPSVDRPLLTH